MMRIRIDINGREIGEVGVWNTQETDDEGRIRYQVHDLRGFEGKHINEAPRVTDVWHHRSYGAASLTQKVMDELPESRLDTRS